MPAGTTARVLAGRTLAPLEDQGDAPFLECARAAGVPLVTGNIRHYPKAIARPVAVLTLAQFVSLLRRAAQS